MPHCERLLKLVGAVALLAGQASCSSAGGPLAPRMGGGSSSEVTSISIGLPSRDGLKDQVADIETKMNGYRLTIKPVDSTCAGATSVDEVGAYASDARLNTSLVQGCDYDLTLALGNRSGGSGSAEKVGYEGRVKTVIDTACASCHSPGASYGDLSSFSAAKAKGARILARAVTEKTMPPSSDLSAADQDVLKAWAAGGYLERSESGDSSSGSGSLVSTYYQNDTPKRIAKEEIQGQAQYRAAISVQLQAGGRAIGLSDGGQVDPADPSDPSDPSDPVDPGDTGPTVNLPTNRNLALTTVSGGSETLASVFKGSYIVVDVSQESCIYCTEAAKKLNQSASEQKMFDGTKCSHVTVVPKAQLNGWLSRIGGKDTFSGKHSYGMSIGFGALGSAFGINFTGTPTFMLLDSDGQVLAYEAGGMPAKVKEVCQ